MGSKRPVLYLDVDGVLNVLGGESEWSDIELHEVTVRSGATYPLWLSREMGRALLDLDVEVRWATTWGDEANEHISPRIGFPTDLPVLAIQHKFSGVLLKSQAIHAEVKNEGRSFIWIDDQAISPQDRTWAKVIGRTGVPNTLIAPDSRVGLTPDHVRSIRGFLTELAPEL